MRNRVINQLKEELEIMKVQKKELAEVLALRKVEIDDWKLYKELKAIQDAELQRIADEEEAERLLEEERIAAEIAAEEELLATVNIIIIILHGDSSLSLFCSLLRKKG